MLVSNLHYIPTVNSAEKYFQNVGINKVKEPSKIAAEDTFVFFYFYFRLKY